MGADRKYLLAVVLLAVLAVAFGVFGTIAPPLTEEGSPVQPQQGSPSESVGHFQNPPTYDSGWVDIWDKAEQYVTLEHDLNTLDMFVDVTGRQSLDFQNGTVWWTQMSGGAGIDDVYSIIQTYDGGYALAGSTNSSGAGGYDLWLVKTDAGGNIQWNQTYGGSGDDFAWDVVQTSDGRYFLAGETASFGNSAGDLYLVETDALGNMLWNQTYGGSGFDAAYSLVLKGSLLVMGGGTDSWGAGNRDSWLIVYNWVQDSWWNVTYGGGDFDVARTAALTPDGGYVLAGNTMSFGAGNRDYYLVKTDANGIMQWNKTYGGSGVDRVYSVIKTADGGYALAGLTSSFGAGMSDCYLVKTDADGNMQWNRTYGGTNADMAWSVIQTAIGEYALAGWTMSSGAGETDGWFIRTDANGNVVWNKTYGGLDNDGFMCMVQAKDLGYVLAGATDSSGTDDFWVIKLYPEFAGTQTTSGEHKLHFGEADFVSGWNCTYGGAKNDEAYSVVQTNDGGYALAGFTYSYSSGTSDVNFWLVKTDSAGNKRWNRTYGGTQEDKAYSVIQTFDGGYALAGSTESYGAGNADFWLVKTDGEGNLGQGQWTKTFGYGGMDVAYSMTQTCDGGYALAGYTDRSEDLDILLVKIDSTGKHQWNKTIELSGSGGPTIDDVAYSVIQTADEGYALTGYTVTYGGPRMFLLKTDSTGNKQWNKIFLGRPDIYSAAYSVIQTSDAGYALAGSTSCTDSHDLSKGKFSLVKTDAAGMLVWNKTYGGGGKGIARCIIKTSDGGYALGGYLSYASKPHDFFLVKTNSLGYQSWSKTYSEKFFDYAYSLIQTSDGGYALTGSTNRAPAGYDFWLIKTDTEFGSMGLSMTGLTDSTVTLYRGSEDPYWNYVRVRIWLIKEPSWIYGDINMDGIVDNKDLYIVGRNYGKSLSLLSLSGIIAVAGIRTVKKRKQNRQPSHIS